MKKIFFVSKNKSLMASKYEEKVERLLSFWLDRKEDNKSIKIFVCVKFFVSNFISFLLGKTLRVEKTLNFWELKKSLCLKSQKRFCFNTV